MDGLFGFCRGAQIVWGTCARMSNVSSRKNWARKAAELLLKFLISKCLKAQQHSQTLTISLCCFQMQLQSSISNITSHCSSPHDRSRARGGVVYAVLEAEQEDTVCLGLTVRPGGASPQGIGRSRLSELRGTQGCTHGRACLLPHSLWCRSASSGSMVSVGCRASMTSPGNRGWWGRGRGASRKGRKVCPEEMWQIRACSRHFWRRCADVWACWGCQRVHRQLAAMGAVPPLP